jgi:hypothetical protein
MWIADRRCARCSRERRDDFLLIGTRESPYRCTESRLRGLGRRRVPARGGQRRSKSGMQGAGAVRGGQRRWSPDGKGRGRRRAALCRSDSACGTCRFRVGLAAPSMIRVGSRSAGATAESERPRLPLIRVGGGLRLGVAATRQLGGAGSAGAQAAIGRTTSRRLGERPRWLDALFALSGAAVAAPGPLRLRS